MPFSGDENRIPFLRLGEREADGLAAVGLDPVLGPFHPGLDFSNDRHRIFAARVVVGHHGDIGKPSHGLAHGGSFLGIAIAAAAEYADQTARAARQLAFDPHCDAVFATPHPRLEQRHGTATVGRMFGPIMLVWFTTIGVLGIRGITMHPEVLKALPASISASYTS